MADYDYGQLIDDFELGVDVMPEEDLTAYIERRRREFESKADGGAIGIEILFGPKRENFRKGGDTIGGKNDKSKTSKGPDRSRVSAQQQSNHDRAMAAAQNNGGGGITNTINNINKTTVFDKAKNLANKVVDSPLTAFIDPRSKLALAMGGYKYLRDGVTPFQQKSIDEELESIQTKGGIVPYADGGRAGYVSGGAALKLLEKGKEGIASLYNAGKSIFSKGDDVVDIAKQEEIFRSGNITTDFLENVDDKVIKKFVATRDAKGPGGYGLYDSFDDMPNGLKAAELISRIKNAEGGINYEAAELFIGKKLKGDETVDELIKLVIKKPGLTDSPLKDFENYVLKGENLADGGRVGLFMGGDPLDGQALSIYNSMNAYGFDDQAIANALQEQGLYTPESSTPDTPDTTIQPVGLQTGSDNFSPYDPDPNSIKPFKPMGANFQNQKPNAFSTGIAKMMDNPVMKTLGFAMNPPLAFAKGILSKAGSMMPVNERSIFENLAGNQGVRVDDIGRIVNTGKYNTPENVMAGYNLNQVTDKTFDKRTDRIEKTLSEKYGLTAEEIEDVKAGTYTGKKGFNTTMGTTTNLFSQLRNILSAKNTILGQQNIAAQMAKQQKEAKAAADALAIQQSGLTDLGNIQKIQQYTGQPLSDYRMSRPASERNYTGGSTNSNPSTPGAQDSFSNKSGMGRTGYSDGGLATMFTRRR